MKKFFKQLFCKHARHFEVVSYYRTYNDYKRKRAYKSEDVYVCDKCGHRNISKVKHYAR